MHVLVLVSLFVFSTEPVSQQPQNFWQVLAEVSFQNVKDPQGYNVEKPVFSKYLRSFHGKKVTVKGYMIPLNEIGGPGKFMLSSLPFNVCYFCGAAGPETVMEIEATEKVKFTTKQIIMEGTLYLNDKDPDHHMYILKSASLKP
jgi:hypothetical protein